MKIKKITLFRIEKDIELYQFYLGLLFKSATFIFTITGAMILYYLANRQNELIRYSLFLPLILNIGFLITCIISIKPAIKMEKLHKKDSRKINFGPSFKMNTLINSLIIFTISYSLVIIGIVILFFIR